MELHQVRYFLALCRTLNFTRAAEACNVTQPALTRAIQRLEDELGGPLLYRERSLTQLTPLGRSMMPHLETMVRAAETVSQAAADMRRQTPLLRLGLVDGLSAGLIAASLAELERRFPGLELHLQSDDQTMLIESLLQGETDAALLVDDGNLPERLDRWKLLHEGCRAVFPQGHAFEAEPCVKLPALATETVVRGDGWGGEWDRFGCETQRLRAASWDQAQHMVAVGLGVALLPRHVAVLPGLLARPVPEAGDMRAVVLAAVNGRMYSPPLDGFLKLNRAKDFTAATAA
nr:LysR family transcriptional regulator [uncultured Rhodopila sp.]